MADISLATFASVFPEFREVASVEPAMVQAALDQAAAQVAEDRLGALYQTGVFLQAAHALAMSPFGEELRLVSDKTSSPYWVRWKQVLASRPKVRILLSGGLPDGSW